jgi:thiol:disulfide interchange protein DsbD
MRRFKLLNISTRVLLLWIAAMSPLCASRLNPVSWSLVAEQGKVAPGSTIVLRLHAQIQDGYHLYSFTTPGGGPIKTTVSLQAGSDIKGLRIYQPTPDRHRDPNLNVPVETFKNGVDFLLRTTLHKSALSGEKVVTASVRYQACSDVICLPPVTKVATTTIGIEPGAAATPTQIPAGYQFVGGSAIRAARSAESATPPIDLHFLLLGFGFGVATLFTPCVFPMIPLTMSFFAGGSNQARSRGFQKAALFCGSIIVLFSTLGVVVTAVAGPFGVVRLATSPWVNGFISFVFDALGLSLLGAFEIALPSGLLRRVDQASRGSGVVSTLSLALTFCLTSFACVGPFVGTLLAASIQTAGWAPALGMLAFAAGLAMPFFLLALFPSYLRKLPCSGPWLERTKTVVGFIVLAASFKYLANVDEVLHWGLLTRERILAIWFALLLAAALYLLGQLRFHAAPSQSDLSLSRLLAALAVLAFAVSLLPGLWGRKLADLEAFLPTDEQTTVSADATHASYSGPAWRKDDYEGAVAEAKLEHKPLLISFSGYTCTNCHWMKANIFPQPTVAAALEDYVLVELYTDGTDAASQRNEKVEQAKFGTIALPYYVISDADGHELAHEDGLTRDLNQFLEFLHTGLASAAVARQNQAAGQA